jgi:branched-chain amino acid transport system substrate-binding protein
VKTVAYIGFSDAYGEGWWNEFSKLADVRKIEVVANERFNRTDTSVTGQILKILAAKPDAVLIGGAGTPAALPQKSLKEKGYKGQIYQTHGVANADFLRVCGKDCEGTMLPTGPVLVRRSCRRITRSRSRRPSTSPGTRPPTERGTCRLSAHTPGMPALLLAAAVPVALKKGQPGTKEFRVALRDALEGVKDLPAGHGVFNMSAQDHLGFDQRARVMVTVDNGAWKLVK